MFRKIKVVAFAVLFLVSFEGVAETARIVNANISKMIVSDGGTYGGCLVLLSDSPKSYLSSCGPGWVTFSCTGDHTSVSSANRMLETAKMAMALNRAVTIRVDDSRTHNGYCYAYDVRIE